MSFQRAARPCLAASSRSSILILNAGARFNSTEESRRLENPHDWQRFQLERQKRDSLINIFSKHGSTQNSENTFQLRDQLHKPKAQTTISALLASGAHFGHASTRMNPNFMPYAYGTRAGITIIDLDHTLPLLRRAVNLVRAVARAGGQILFIGTRPDLRPVIQKAAERLGPQGFHVGERWVPGTLSNRRQIFGGGVVDKTNVVPDLAIILNPLSNAIAISELSVEHVPTIGVIDSNVDPRVVMYPIPANDENTRTAELLAGVLSVAGREGVALRQADLLQKAYQSDKRSRIQNRRS